MIRKSSRRPPAAPSPKAERRDRESERARTAAEPADDAEIPEARPGYSSPCSMELDPALAPSGRRADEQEP